MWLPMLQVMQLEMDGGYVKSINTNCIRQLEVLAEWLPWLHTTVVMRG